MATRSVLPTALLLGLVDDAAVFPPGNAPLDQAVVDHRRHRQAPYSRYVGPLLVPVGMADQLSALVGPEPLEVVAIARPGTDPQSLRSALATLTQGPARVRGVELGWTPGWRDLVPDGMPAAVEVGRDRPLGAQLDDLAEAQGPVVAKLRTGATTTWAWPDEDEVAAFLLESARRGLGTKLTGGLHHAVRATHGPDLEDQHGLLNVLLATEQATRGAAEQTVAATLRERDPVVLSTRVREVFASEEAVTATRGLFTAYGCCLVTDPIGELDALGLLA